MIDVTCAIIRNEEDEILVVQRNGNGDHPFKWEFPGGKIKDCETDEECIIREINEELAIGIIIRNRMDDVRYDYGHKQIRLIPFVCDTLEDFPDLLEHNDFKWINPSGLNAIDFCEADLIVASEYLKNTKVPGEKVERDTEYAGQPLYNENDLQTMVGTSMGIKEAEWMAESAFDNKEILDKLIDYSFSHDRKLAFRASWILSKVYDKHPDIIDPIVYKFIENLDKLDNESVQRSFLRIVSLSDITQTTIKHQGILADHSFRMLKSGTSSIAVKAYCMEIIYKLALIYPELANELSATIKVLQGEGSAGILARGHIILKKLAGRSLD